MYYIELQRDDIWVKVNTELIKCLDIHPKKSYKKKID